MRPTFINFAKSLLAASAKSNYGRTIITKRNKR